MPSKYIISEEFLNIFKEILQDNTLSDSFKAETLILPSI